MNQKPRTEKEDDSYSRGESVRQQETAHNSSLFPSEILVPIKKITTHDMKKLNPFDFKCRKNCKRCREEKETLIVWKKHLKEEKKLKENWWKR